MQYPYTYRHRQRTDHLAAAEAAYQAKLKKAGREGTRFDDAMNIVVGQSYCVKCHIVADYEPTSSQRALAPDLSQVYKRLRPDYLRRWIARPSSILPYTAMPVNVPYKPSEPNTGTTVPQDLYHGNSQRAGASHRFV